MSKVKSFLMVAVAVTGATMASSCFAQSCNSCNSAPAAAYAVAPASCDTCASGGGASFSYPTGGACQSVGGGGIAAVGGRGGRACASVSELKARYQHTQAINARIEARNDAWPKPFGCADRQLAFSFWDPMIDRGFEEQCVLTSAHFDAETNELNRFGQTAVAGIMQNMPSNRRRVFLNRDVDSQVSDARKQSVEQTIQTFYGNSGPAMVAFSSRRPNTTTGAKGALIQERWLEGQATPAIPVSVGGDVSSAVSSGN